MKKIFIAIIILALVAGGAYYILTRDKGEQRREELPSTEAPAECPTCGD